MSADFWAGYISGAAGILIGNPLDLVKTRLQAGNAPSNAAAVGAPGPSVADAPKSFRQHFDRAGTLVKGTTAPLLTYGALNALLFTTYNRSLAHLHPPPSPAPLTKTFLAGALSGLTTFLLSTPTELIKCRAQVSLSPTQTSWSIARSVWNAEGLRGLYYGGGITSVRDGVGYGFYFLSYEWSRRAVGAEDDSDAQTAVKVLLCGGFAGIVTWASVFPLDVVKTRVQTQLLETPGQGEGEGEGEALLRRRVQGKRLSTLEVALKAYQSEGTGVFFRGLGICSVRAFVVNAVQWAVYEWMMRLLRQP